MRGSTETEVLDADFFLSIILVGNFQRRVERRDHLGEGDFT